MNEINIDNDSPHVASKIAMGVLLALIPIFLVTMLYEASREMPQTNVEFEEISEDASGGAMINIPDNCPEGTKLYGDLYVCCSATPCNYECSDCPYDLFSNKTSCCDRFIRFFGKRCDKNATEWGFEDNRLVGESCIDQEIAEKTYNIFCPNKPDFSAYVFDVTQTVDVESLYEKGKWRPIQKYNKKLEDLVEHSFRNDSKVNCNPKKILLWEYWPKGSEKPLSYTPDMKEFLEGFRGKTIFFVGDSLMNQQYAQLLASIGSWFNGEISMRGQRSLPHLRSNNIVLAENIKYLDDYNIRIIHVNLPYSQDQTIPLEDIEKYEWSNCQPHLGLYGAVRNDTYPDVVVFNLGHWYFEGYERLGPFYIGGKNPLNPNDNATTSIQDHLIRYAQAIDIANTVALQWKKKNSKLRIFWREMSRRHFEEDGGCPETQPHKDESVPLYSNQWAEVVQNRILRHMIETYYPNDAEILEVAHFARERYDAHKSHKDCSHWCPPSIPVLWNTVLIEKILGDAAG